MSRMCVLMLSVLAVALACTLAMSARGHRMLRDIEYATVDGTSLTLDLYLPSEPAEDPIPLVLWVHGGGWRAGDKAPTYAPETLGEGYAVASVNYRLSDEAVFPAQIHDVKAAVRFLRENAGRFNVDPERFGAWGSSAGGHLVALLGTSCGVPELEGELGDNLGVSSCVQAVCDFFGPTDLLALFEQRGERTRRPMPEDHLIGGLVEEHAALATLASPIAHIDGTDPSFLIMHGSEDPTVPVEQSIAFDETLRAAGIDSTLIVVEGAGHGLPRTKFGTVKTFFDKQLHTTVVTLGP
jgi:acetyl esterase/lipase